MYEFIKYQFNICWKKYGIGVVLSLFNGNVGYEVLVFYKKLFNYVVMLLYNLVYLSWWFGLGFIYIKDEFWCFGLNVFKGLGGFYVVGKYFVDKL